MRSPLLIPTRQSSRLLDAEKGAANDELSSHHPQPSRLAPAIDRLRIWWGERKRRRRASGPLLGGGGVSPGSPLVRKLVIVALALVALALLVLIRSNAQAIPSRSSGALLPHERPSTFHWTGVPQWYLPPTEHVDSPSPLVRHGPPREIDIASDPLPLEATLDERLAVWQASPGGRGPGVHLGLDGQYHEEIEPGGFVQLSLESCSGIDHQLNTHMVQKSATVWGSMNRTSIWQARMSLIEHMRDVQREGLLKRTGHGRGIVMVAGNADTLHRVKWSVALMRSRGGRLPVQVYHFPEERPDPTSEIVQQLRELDVELVEAPGQTRDAGQTKSYHLKALAIVECPWQEVLYLDSDSIPVTDPEYMFDAPSYKRLGIWATPDYWKTSANSAIWAILGVRCRNEWEMESGQMFIDKARHLDVFHLVLYMLQEHHFFYYMSDGDKDLFRWALLALRKRWGTSGRFVGSAALPGPTLSGDFCSHTMAQHDAYGAVLFVHANLLKSIPSGVGRGFSWGRHKSMSLMNFFPATPATARENEDTVPGLDESLSGLGDVDCDMLADADDEGNARAPAREEVRRRAARERGIKVRYHGGVVSALCIDVDMIDPRPRVTQELARQRKEDEDKAWEEAKERAKEQGLPEPPRTPVDAPVVPDWSASAIEVHEWKDDDRLASFENDLYDEGFVPNGKGF